VSSTVKGLKKSVIFEVIIGVKSKTVVYCVMTLHSCHGNSNTSELPATLYLQDRRKLHAEDGGSRFILDD
jgi:hypothetical protein